MLCRFDEIWRMFSVIILREKDHLIAQDRAPAQEHLSALRQAPKNIQVLSGSRLYDSQLRHSGDCSLCSEWLHGEAQTENAWQVPLILLSLIHCLQMPLRSIAWPH